MTGREPLAIASEETGATTDDDHLLDPGRLKPRPFGAFVFAIAAHKVADAARGAARANRTGELGAPGPGQRRPQ